ncbi:hypothetical protein [Rubritalea squalenifaciens]|nr:hypothetical protein [Rubritalea squalenifaciens]
MAQERNLNYKSQQFSYYQTTQRRSKLWKGLVPRVFTYVNISSSIDEIADITSDDLSLNIASSLNIPNPVQFYSQLYSIALLEIQSKHQLEIQRRQLVIQLYSLFIQHQELERRTQELIELGKSLESLSPNKLITAIETLEAGKTQVINARERLRVSTNSMLNTPGKNWKLTGAIPKISYEKKIDKLSFKNGYGLIGLKLQAIQIEGILISKLDAQISRLPSISVGMTSPQLYSNNSEQNFQFNAADYELFTGLSKSIDLTDIFSTENIRNANFRAKTSRDQLLLSMESEISRLESTKALYKRLIQRRETIRKQVNTGLSADTVALPALVSQQIRTYQSAQKELESLEKQITQLDIQLWVWDDTKW